MPNYCRVCPSCSHRFERFAKMSEHHAFPCPSCGTASEPDLGAQGVPGTGNHVLHFSWETEAMRMEYGFSPREVVKARQTFGGRAAECICDDGKVRPPDTASAKEFIQKWGDMYDRKQAKEEAAGL